MAKMSAEHLSARRQQILEAARDCFALNGFHATSMQDILAASGMSAGGLYRYFKSKDELVEAIATDVLASLGDACEVLVAAPQLPPLEETVVGLLALLLRVDGERAFLAIAVQVWAEALRTPSLAARVADLLAGVRRDLTRVIDAYQVGGQIDPSVAPDHVARVLSMFIQGFIIQRAILHDIDLAAVEAGLHALLQPALRSWRDAGHRYPGQG